MTVLQVRELPHFQTEFYCSKFQSLLQLQKLETQPPLGCREESYGVPQLGQGLVAGRRSGGTGRFTHSNHTKAKVSLNLFNTCDKSRDEWKNKMAAKGQVKVQGGMGRRMQGGVIVWCMLSE